MTELVRLAHSFETEYRLFCGNFVTKYQAKTGVVHDRLGLIGVLLLLYSVLLYNCDYTHMFMHEWA